MERRVTLGPYQLVQDSPCSGEYWTGGHDDCVEGTVRMIDGKLHHLISEKEINKWIPVAFIRNDREG